MGFIDAVKEAGSYGKMNVITTGFTEKGFDWKDKYNIWSGLIGGFFLALSYFGTDHSQVGKYLTGKNIAESRKGLLMNGLVKVPMQFCILLIGILIFTFYLYHKAPVYFDETKIIAANKTEFAAELKSIEAKYVAASAEKNIAAVAKFRGEFKATLKKALPGDDANDTNFIFLRFVKDNLPIGLTGLLFAVIFLSAWGSIAGALNSLAACSMIDFHQKFYAKDKMELSDYKTSQWYTFGWGVFCIIIAMFAQNIGNSLIEAVNILGSIFYGVILGVFIVAFWINYIKANAVFISALISQVGVIVVYKADIISFLWLNVIGVGLVVGIGLLLQLLLSNKKTASKVVSGF